MSYSQQLQKVPFVAGGLRNNMDYWKAITYDKTILEYVQGYEIEFVTDVPTNISRTTNSGDPKILKQQVDKLLSLGVVELATPSINQILSPIFVVPKTDGTFRLILNLKSLNEFVVYRHFKMENINRVRELLFDNCYLASIDLEKAYYSVPVGEASRKYLRFQLNDVLYQFTCLPNGLSSAPYIFTRLMKVVFSSLRKAGHSSIFYLDDSLLVAPTKMDCLKNISSTVDILQRVGFTISWEKSVLVPTHIIEFLGFRFNSQNMELSLPIRKQIKISEACLDLLSTENPIIRATARVTGLLVSALPAFSHGKLHYRNLESCKNLALSQVRGNFDKRHQLSEDAKLNLYWWSEGLDQKTGVAVSLIKSYDFEVFSDACLSGFGFCFNRENVAGSWSPTDLIMANQHINGLEMLAVLKGLVTYKQVFRDKSILVRCDNATAVHYINDMGGLSSNCCDKIAKDVWSFCLEWNIAIEAAFIAGSDNIRADALSRLNNNTELSLNQDAMAMIVNVLGIIDIDLFASANNAKCETFVSWKPDASAFAVNAFTVNWKDFKLAYAFPPFSLMGRVLQKASKECCNNLVVVFPLWTGQPWYPRLQKLLKGRPWKLPFHPLQKTHALGKSLQLAFGKI